MSERERFERSFKTKARANYLAAAVLLFKFPNAAANRIYYCLFQALVGELAAKGIRPQDIDAGAAHAAKDRGETLWTHSFIKANARMAGLDGRQRDVLRIAYELRTIADYKDTDVDSQMLSGIMRQIPDILECLGVNVGA